MPALTLRRVPVAAVRSVPAAPEGRRVLVGDCRRVLATLPEASVDSIVTDPPYDLTAGKKGGTGAASLNLDSPYGRSRISTGNGGGFMGKDWDATGVAFDPETWCAALRVLKPGGYLLAFGGTRTYHRMVCAIEDAGFEIRDQVMWVYGSGFPKSHNGEWGGTALKPAWEPIVMARKAPVGTVEANWMEYGTGGLNIDGCRVHGGPSSGGSASGSTALGQGSGWNAHENRTTAIDRSMAAGRWPANLIHDGSDEVLAAFPAAPGQQGDLKETGRPRPSSGRFGDMAPPHAHPARQDTGSAARFFYCAKTSKADRGEGNTHPTVKPTDLMRYLCRLVTPAGGVVLDPFTGSGSTGKAALLEGLDFIGIEQSAEYAAIAESRIALARATK